MDGVSNTIKEVSDSYSSLYNEWKYTINQDADGIIIRYMENHNNKWEIVSSININFSCAEILFDEVLECLRNGSFAPDIE